MNTIKEILINAIEFGLWTMGICSGLTALTWILIYITPEKQVSPVQKETEEEKEKVLKKIAPAIEYMKNKEMKYAAVPTTTKPPKKTSVKVTIEKEIKPAEKQQALPKRAILDENLRNEIRKKLLKRLETIRSASLEEQERPTKKEVNRKIG
jgi:hypothetical protein